MPPSPLTLAVDTLAAMLNCELASHPVYDGVELQWFDDPRHGTGMLAFLSRRDGRVVDYYVDPGLRIDRDGYHIGGGTGTWTETTFAVARLHVAEDGVDAEVRFTDVDGRCIHVRVDDRDGVRRRRAGLLAPVGSAVEDPTSLMLVWMPGFDLVRATRRPPLVRIDGEDAAIGRLPGGRLHKRHLVKYAAPVVTVFVAGEAAGRLGDLPDARTAGVPGDGPTTVVARAELPGAAPVEARLELTPAWPDLAALPEGRERRGRWRVGVDDAWLTGGDWFARRADGTVGLGLDVTQRWRPRRLPLLMRVVTTVVPVFRRWPTTYRWRGTVVLGADPVFAGGWERLASSGADAYRRATGSAVSRPTDPGLSRPSGSR